MYSKIKRVSALLLVLVMLSSQNVLFPTSAQDVKSKTFSTNNCTITVTETSSWIGGYNADVTVQNNTDKDMHHWMICSDLNASKISNCWCAKVINGVTVEGLENIDGIDDTNVVNSTNDHYAIFSNETHNAMIPASGSITFGYSSKGDFSNFTSMELIESERKIFTDSYSISTNVVATWDNKAQIDVSIDNQSDIDILDWAIRFDFDGNIDTIWNATLVSNKDHTYIISNNGQTGMDIVSGGKTTFSFIAEFSDISKIDFDHMIANTSLSSTVFDLDEINDINTTESNTTENITTTEDSSNSNEDTDDKSDEQIMEELEEKYSDVVADCKKNLDLIHADELVDRNTEQDSEENQNTSSESNRVKVCILDSGIDYNSGLNVVEQKDFLGYEMSDVFADLTGHGTAIAGVLAGDSRCESRNKIDDDLDEERDEESNEDNSKDESGLDEDEFEIEYDDTIEFDEDSIDGDVYPTELDIEKEILDYIDDEYDDSTDVSEIDLGFEDFDEVNESNNVEVDEAFGVDYNDYCNLSKFFICGLCSNVDIYSGRILDTYNNATVDSAVNGIDWAIENEVDIISVSWGTKINSPKLYDAIRRAYDAGILVVAAAGNDADIQFPAKYKEVIAVGAVDLNFNLQDEHPVGEELELVAPGFDVCSYGSFGMLDYFSGCSIAVPYVVGLATLLLQKNHSLSMDQIRFIMDKTAHKLGDSNKYGYGLIDCKTAIDYLNFIDDNNMFSTKKIELYKQIFSSEQDITLKGMWGQKEHKNMVNSQTKYIKCGAILTDMYPSFKGMVNNPGFHGFCGTESKNNITNYLKAYFYLMDQAIWIKNQPNDKSNFKKLHEIDWYSKDYDEGIKKMSDKFENKIDKFFKYAGKYYEFDYKKLTNKQKFYIVYGMALHSLADIFAHSSVAYQGVTTQKNGKKYRLMVNKRFDLIKHGSKVGNKYLYAQADDKGYRNQRYIDADAMVKKYLSAISKNISFPKISDLCFSNNINHINDLEKIKINLINENKSWATNKKFVKALAKIYTLRRFGKYYNNFINYSNILQREDADMKLDEDIVRIGEGYVNQLLNNIVEFKVSVKNTGNISLDTKKVKVVLQKKVNGKIKNISPKIVKGKYICDISDKNAKYYITVVYKKKKKYQGGMIDITDDTLGRSSVARLSANNIMNQTVYEDQMITKEIKINTYCDDDGDSLLAGGCIIPLDYYITVDLALNDNTSKNVVRGCVFETSNVDYQGSELSRIPANNVLIKFLDSQKQEVYKCTSDEEGMYSVPNLKNGKYIMLFSKDGYDSIEVYINYLGGIKNIMPISMLPISDKSLNYSYSNVVDYLTDFTTFCLKFKTNFNTTISVRKGIDNFEGEVVKTIHNTKSGEVYNELFYSDLDNGYYTAQIDSFDIGGEIFAQKYYSFIVYNGYLYDDSVTSAECISNVQQDKMTIITSDCLTIKIKKDGVVYTLNSEADYVDYNKLLGYNGANVYISKYDKYKYEFDVANNIDIDIYMGNSSLNTHRSAEVYYQNNFYRYYEPFDNSGYWNIFEYSNDKDTIYEKGAIVNDID